MIVAPKSTETQLSWGSYGTVRSTTSTTDGVANTTTLFNLGSAAHPAAYYCRALSTGGYNNWYLPAKDELMTLYSNKSATPFVTANSFIGADYWSSTELDGGKAGRVGLDVGNNSNASKGASNNVRATRRAFIATTVGQGDATVGFWLGTAGDGTSKLIVAPKSTEVVKDWGSYGTRRPSASNFTSGATNTSYLYSFGSAAHPAAYYCKTLTTGGYNTWYMPAKNELYTCYSNKSATPFATNDGFINSYHLSSTESNANNCWMVNPTDGTVSGDIYGNKYTGSGFYVRPVRQVN